MTTELRDATTTENDATAANAANATNECRTRPTGFDVDN